MNGGEVKRWKFIVDLSEVDLGGIDLSEVGFSKDNLSEVDLSKVDLGKVDFCKVDFSKAKLMGLYIASFLNKIEFSIDRLTPEQLEIVVSKGAILFNEDYKRVDRNGNILKSDVVN